MDTGPIVGVSASEQLRRPDAVYDWTLLRHRLQQMERDVAGFDFPRITACACRRLGGRLRSIVAERIAALRRPLDESEIRIQQIETLSDRIEELLTDLDSLLAAAEQQLAGYFRQQHEQFTRQISSSARTALQAKIAEFKGQSRFRERAFDAAQSLAREMVEQWLRTAELEATELFRTAVSRVVDAASDAFGRMVTALDVTAASIDADEAVGDLAGRQRFFFTSLMRLTSGNAMAALWQRLRGNREDAALKDADAYFVRLLDTNASPAATYIIDRLHETRARLRGVLCHRLTELTNQARASLDRARELHRHGEAAVAAELVHLDAVRVELDRLLANVGASPTVR